MPRALLSVSDKSGLPAFASKLVECSYELVSSGGTAKMLAENEIPVTKVSEVTQFQEMLDGRVKTLHPAIHGGILARRSEDHLGQLAAAGITPIDLVAVNLYPFAETVSRGAAADEVIENIDIGGPTLLRSAAKNHEFVTVVTDPGDYMRVASEIAEGGTSSELRRELAQKAFRHTSSYDTMITNWFAGGDDTLFPPRLDLELEKVTDLRYGENPHQQAAYYRDLNDQSSRFLTAAEQLSGRQLSYNNLIDLESAWAIVNEFDGATAAVIKHTNPCGAASAAEISDAFRIAHAADSLSAYGCVIGLNRTVDEATVDEIKGKFVEAIVAPDYDEAAYKRLRKVKKRRILKLPMDGTWPPRRRWQAVSGGLLAQSTQWPRFDPSDWKVVSEATPTDDQLKAMVFGCKVARHVKSNTVMLVNGERTVGVGAGQMSRVDASIIAARKAGEEAEGSVLVSDAFFPFRDGIDAAAAAGISAIIQPGGSIRDEETIAAANEHGISMVFSGIRLFRH